MFDILSARGSIVCLVLIGLLLVGGNLLIDKSDPVTPGEDAASASQVVSSESSTLLIFNLPAELEELKLRQEAHLLAATEEKRSRVRLRRSQLAEFKDLPGSVSRATLESIADCESGGDPKVVSADGLYHGKYQFSPETWKAVGGKGLPSKASEAEQDYRAALLYERSGPGQWPVCGS